MQMGFYFDQTRCTNCYVCVVACKDWNDVPAGPASWRRVTSIERGEFPNVFVAAFSSSCYHCAVPLCLAACPVMAITKRREDGIVIVDREVCIGGDECEFACREACPYDMPQFGPNPNPKMQKCNFCIDRLTGNKRPICVDSCPTYALDAGPLDVLAAKYGDIKEAEGFVYSTDTRPSIVIKPKRSTSIGSAAVD